MRWVGSLGLGSGIGLACGLMAWELGGAVSGEGGFEL